MIELCDRIRLAGELTIKVYDVKDGQAILTRRMTNKNQVTNDGRQVLIDLLGQMGMSPTVSDPTYNQLWSFEAGTDGTPTTVGDVGLGATAWSSRFLAPEVSVIPSPTFEIFIDKIMPTSPMS